MKKLLSIALLLTTSTALFAITPFWEMMKTHGDAVCDRMGRRNVDQGVFDEITFALGPETKEFSSERRSYLMPGLAMLACGQPATPSMTLKILIYAAALSEVVTQADVDSFLGYLKSVAKVEAEARIKRVAKVEAEARTKVCDKKSPECNKMYPDFCKGKCVCDQAKGLCMPPVDLTGYVGPVNNDGLRKLKTWDQLCNGDYKEMCRGNCKAYPNEIIISGTKHCWAK